MRLPTALCDWSLCEWNTAEEVEYMLAEIPKIVAHLRDMSPV